MLVVKTLVMIIGSLGLFLYGMMRMSDSLQKVTGSSLRKFFAKMTSNPFKQVLCGLVITTAIQSSSATTVMVVSFVNASLLSLSQAIGVIMGANIGTTITAWIIAILGFKFDISLLSIPLLGLGFFLSVMKEEKKKLIGDFICGFSLLFLGLSFLKASIPDLTPETVEFLNHYTDMGNWSVLLFVIIGAIITIVLQSSSATVALTMTMCALGWLPFHIAAAMVLGENLGTTVTALIASSVANTSGRRAAVAHAVFNLIGVFWAVTIFNPYIRIVSSIVSFLGGGDPMMAGESDTTYLYGLSAVHSIFNISNTLILVWFIPKIEKLVRYIIKDSRTNDEIPRLLYITAGLMEVSELSLVQARKEIVHMAKIAKQEFIYARQAVATDDSAERKRLIEKLAKYEQITDNIEFEIADYLNQIGHGYGSLGKTGAIRMRAKYRIIDELESIGDSGFGVGRVLKRMDERGFLLTAQMKAQLDGLFALLDKAMDEMIKNLSGSYSEVTNIDASKQVEMEINALRDELIMDVKEKMQSGGCDYPSCTTFTDIANECEHAGDYIINVSETMLRT